MADNFIANKNIFKVKNKSFIIKAIEDTNFHISDSIQAEIEMFVKPLFIEYQNYLLNCGVDLSFQNFQTELEKLPGIYSKENKGNIILIFNFELVDNNVTKNLIPVGMVSLKDLGNNICEMKRLFVIDSFRRFGLGKKLMDEIIVYAKRLGYNKLRWDTLKKLSEASFLYEKYNYKQIHPYNYNPFDDVVYYELDLHE